MNLQFYQNIKWHLSLLLILLSFIDVTQLSGVVDLFRITCCIDQGTKITSIPNECTAIAKYASNDKTSFQDIRKIKNAIGNKMKFVYIVNNWSFDDMKKQVESGEKFYKYLNQLISDNNINAMIFDNLYTDDTRDNVDKDLQNNIYSLFEQMKKSNSTVLFGLALSKNMDHMKFAFNLNLLDNIVDVYLANTLSYCDCQHRSHQIEMDITSPVAYMSDTLQNLVKLGYNLSKTILNIEVIVKSSKFAIADSSGDMSYAELCTNSFSERRKFCIDSLSNYNQKGLLVYTNKMTGALIQSIDRDDYDNSCSCTPWPVLQSISEGLKKNCPINITTCYSFGKIKE